MMAMTDVSIHLNPQVTVRDLGHVGVVLDVQTAPSLLGTHKCEQNDVGIDGAHEDANDLAVVVALDCLAILDQRFKWPVGSEFGFDGR